MKLTQKLAMVLASVMVVTSAPIVTMATSENRFDREISMVIGETITTDDKLNIEIKVDSETLDTTESTFYIESDDFEFDVTAYENFNSHNVKISNIDKDGMEVTISSKTGLTDEKFLFPVYGVPESKDASIEINGRNSVVTSGVYSLNQHNNMADKALTVEIDEISKLPDSGNGRLGSIKITENKANSLNGETVIIELDRRSNLVFARNQDITITGTRGFRGKTIDGTIKRLDDTTLQVTFAEDEFGKNSQIGAITINDIQLEAENARKGASLGDVKVTISSKDDTFDEVKLVATTIAEKGINISVEDEVQLKAGKTSEITVLIDENTVGSLKNDIYFKIDGGKFNTETLPTEIKIDDEVVANLEYNKYDEELQLEFTDNLDRTKVNELEFDLDVYVDANREGKVSLVATSKNTEDVIIPLGEISSQLIVETEPFNGIVGINNKTTGKITITETEDSMLEKGDILTIKLDKSARRNGIRFDDFFYSSDIDLKGGIVDDDTIELKVTGTTYEPSQILMSVGFSVQNLVPLGGYDVELGGSLVAENDKDSIVLKDFIIINDKEKVQTTNETVFTVGNPNFNRNDKVITMEVAPFIAKNGSMMVPLEYLPKAFGINEQDIILSNGIATIFTDKQIIQLTNNSNKITVGGVSLKIDDAMTTVDNTTFVPISELANILQMSIEWDNEAKTVSFIN